MSAVQLRVGLIGAFDPYYPRHQILIAGLERSGVEVQLFPLSRKASTLRQMPTIWQLRSELRRCDAVLVPAFNQLLAPMIGLVGRRGRTIVDYMVGLTDALVDERGDGSGSTVRHNLFALIDRYNLSHFPTLTDTRTHKGLFERFAGRSLPHMQVIPVGVYDRWFYPRPTSDSDPLLVQFFGSYIPFHGIELIVEAAAQLASDPRVRFELIGRGQTYKAIRADAARRGLSNLTFSDPVPPDKLPDRVAAAAICLGVFGARPKTDYVVPNKVYQCLAIGRPLITAESTALNEYFTPGRDLITVPPGDPSALTDAIRQLADSPTERGRLSAAATNRIQAEFQPEQVVAPLFNWLTSLSSRN